MNSNNPFTNAEGYPDPTAYFGEKAVRKEESETEKRIGQLVGMIKLLADLAGFSIVGRITVRDNKTGREYK